MNAEVASHRGNGWRDGVVIAVAALSSYVVASYLELHEWVSARLSRFEMWQADEIPFGLGVLSIGLAWYAMRRRAEMRRELIARIAMERQVRALLASNAALGHRLIATQEAERRALARELHDEVGGAIAALRAETTLLCRCATDDHAGMRDAAQRSADAAEQVYGLVRGLLGQLRPAVLDLLGLVPALQELCGTFEERHGIACRLCVASERQSYGDPVDITIYRIVQESLTNVARHSHATSVFVQLAESEERWIRCSVEDNGRGFTPDAKAPGFGLAGARERVSAIGGEITAGSGGTGSGTRISFAVPILDAAPDRVESDRARSTAGSWREAA